MMSEMVERVRQALEMHRLESVHEDEARAAIAAMREPDRIMLDAGMTAADDALDSDWESDADGGRHEYSSLRSDAPSDIWTAMIDAALGDKQ